MKRRRVGISLSESEYIDLKRIAHDYKFGSITTMCADLIKVFRRRVLSAEHLASMETEDDDEINSMFREFTDWQAPHYGSKTTSTPHHDIQ